MTFFLEVFLKSREMFSLSSVDAEMVRYFLGNWYIHRAGPRRRELDGFICTLKRFYRFLCDEGQISREVFEEISAVCAQRAYFHRRLEQYHELEQRRSPTRALLKWHLALEFPGRPIRGLHFFPSLKPDPGLALLVRNLERPKAPMPLDFTLFLDYISHNVVHLTPASSHLPRKHLHRLNARFSVPERLSRNFTQGNTQRIHLFYHLALALELASISDFNTLEPGPRAEEYLNLVPESQYILLIHALWNELDWAELECFRDSEFAGLAQEYRGAFAQLLSRLTPDEEWHIGPLFSPDRHSRLIAGFLLRYKIVEIHILYALQEMGVLHYRYRAGRDPYLVRGHRGIKTIIITRFGRRIMSYLARPGLKEFPGSSLLDRMEDSISFI
jgi:hypothetical protein